MRVANVAGRTVFVLLLTGIVFGSKASAYAQSPSRDQNGSRSQITIPTRPPIPLHTGELGKQGSETKFTPASRTVTLKLMVEDPKGYFVPSIRRDNFAVYEDGVRQKNVTVEIEHAPVTVALLLEFGGRYHELNKVLAQEVPQAAHQLLDVVGRDDKVAAFKYDSKLQTIADFSQGHEVLEGAFDHLETPGFSEANFYDALQEALNRMRSISGRKAVIVTSSGIDTFSKTSYEQVLELARDAGTPIYTIGLDHLMEQQASSADSPAFARFDWTGAEKRLEMLAKVSGGRAYSLDSSLRTPGVYDDIMENLRVRYVVTYVSSNPALSGPPRKIRVTLVNPKNGAPLIIRDDKGRSIAAKVFVQDSYSPTETSRAVMN